MSEKTNANDDARALLMGTTPERADAITELLKTTQYEIAHDRPALHLEATAFFGKGLVVLTKRTMQQAWLIAYLSWRTLREQAGFIIVALATKAPYEVRLHSKNDKYISLVNRLGEALAALRTADAGNNPWPPDVPRLDPQLSELHDEEDHFAYALGCFATAFLLLHETCHAQKRVRGEPEGGIAEEIECDKFAIDFLMAGCEIYARQNDYEITKVRRKRSMGVFLGLAVVFESTEHGLWAPSNTHPSAYERIKLLVDIVEPGLPEPNDDFWTFASCVLLSKLRRNQRLPEVIHFDSCRDLFYKVLVAMKLE
jgi:hypothetical protein